MGFSHEDRAKLSFPNPTFSWVSSLYGAIGIHANVTLIVWDVQGIKSKWLLKGLEE